MSTLLQSEYADAADGITSEEAEVRQASRSVAPTLSLRPYRQGLNLWATMLEQAPQASLYHSRQWHLILSLAYGLELVVAALEDDAGPIAGCVLAHSRMPLSRRLTALPFSDYCPPLELRRGGSTQLTRALAQQLLERRQSCELRGIAALSPWWIDDRFQHWMVDLQVSAGAIEKAMDRNFRRQVKRAREGGITLARGSSADDARRFYALHLESRRRLGLPAPPWRFFRLIAEIMGEAGDFEVWLAAAGGRDVGGVVLLKDRVNLHCKWSARTADAPVGAMQFLFWSICMHYAGAFQKLDLGKTDIHNQGLSRFKREMGAVPAPLPYAFYPDLPRRISSEDLHGTARLAAALWRRLPPPVARALGGAIYGYLS